MARREDPEIHRERGAEQQPSEQCLGHQAEHGVHAVVLEEHLHREGQRPAEAFPPEPPHKGQLLAHRQNLQKPEEEEEQALDHDDGVDVVGGAAILGAGQHLVKLGPDRDHGEEKEDPARAVHQPAERGEVMRHVAGIVRQDLGAHAGDIHAEEQAPEPHDQEELHDAHLHGHDHDHQRRGEGVLEVVQKAGQVLAKVQRHAVRALEPDREKEEAQDHHVEAQLASGPLVLDEVGARKIEEAHKVWKRLHGARRWPERRHLAAPHVGGLHAHQRMVGPLQLDRGRHEEIARQDALEVRLVSDAHPDGVEEVQQHGPSVEPEVEALEVLRRAVHARQLVGSVERYICRAAAADGGVWMDKVWGDLHQHVNNLVGGIQHAFNPEHHRKKDNSSQRDNQPKHTSSKDESHGSTNRYKERKEGDDYDEPTHSSHWHSVIPDYTRSPSKFDHDYSDKEYFHTRYTEPKQHIRRDDMDHSLRHIREKVREDPRSSHSSLAKDDSNAARMQPKEVETRYVSEDEEQYPDEDTQETEQLHQKKSKDQPEATAEEEEEDKQRKKDSQDTDENTGKYKYDFNGLFARYRTFQKVDSKKFKKEIQKGFTHSRQLDRIIDIAEENIENADHNQGITDDLKKLEEKFIKLNKLLKKRDEKSRSTKKRFSTAKEFISNKLSNAKNHKMFKKDTTKIQAEIDQIIDEVKIDEHFQNIFVTLGIDIERLFYKYRNH